MEDTERPRPDALMAAAGPGPGASLRALADLSRAMSAEAQPAQALWRLVTAVRTGLGIDRAGIFAYDPQARMLLHVAGVDRAGGPEFGASQWPVDDEIAPLKQVARRELPYYLSEDVRRDYPWCSWNPAMKGHCVVPIVAGDEFLGALCVDNSLTGHALPASLLEPLFLYASLAALPLFALYQKRERDRTDALRLHLAREVLFAVTEGRFHLCDRDEIEAEWPSLASSLEVRREADVGTVREAVRAAGERAGMGEERAADLALCASEAATNALLHGGGGRVAVGEADGRVRVCVADQGGGIDPEDLPRATLLKGWSKRASMGLGFTIIHETADRLYLATGPSGTTLLIEMNVEPETASVPGAAIWGDLFSDCAHHGA